MDSLSPETAGRAPARPRLRGNGRQLAVVFVLAALALPGVAPTEAQTSSAPRVIVGAALRAVPGGAELDIVATEPLRWSAGAVEENRIVIELADARPGAGLRDIESRSGIVARVGFEPSNSDGRPSTRVLVTTRRVARYTLAADGRVLTLKIRPVAESAAAGLEAAPRATPGPVNPSPSPAAATTEPAALGEYTIGAGDVVSLSVFGIEELDRQTRVQADGQIAVPLLGRVKIAGLTVGQAEAEIGRILRERQLVTQPQVLVVVEEYASYGVTVQGAVVRPGVYPVIGRQSLLEVIWAAGGLLESTAADQKILVLRQDPAGRSERLEVDAYRLLDEGDLSLNLSLRPGDRVVVPKPQRHTVYISGAVRRPGPVEFGSSAGLTVLQAVTLAGGPTERANLSKVTVIRQVEGGGQETIRVNLKKIQKGKAQDVYLQNNDTIQVGVWFF